MAGERLHAYAGTEEKLAREIFDQFEKETGIEVEWARLSGGDAVARIEAERKAPAIDLWFGGVGTTHIELKNKGLTIPYTSKAADIIPEKYRDADHFWTGLYVAPISFCYNKQLMDELDLPVPFGWEDLTDPIYAKQVRVAHPASSGTAYNILTNVIRVYGGDEEKAFSYFKRLHNSIDEYTKSGSAPGKACAAGQIPIAIGYHHDQYRLLEDGAEIGIILPVEGSGYETASMSLIKGGPNPETAKKFYDWVLTSEFAHDTFKRWHVISVAEAQNPDSVFNILTLVNQDDAWDAANKARLLERWNREIAPPPAKR